MSLKIGVFGAYRGKTMIDVLTYYREAQLVAVCDMYEPALDKIKKEAQAAGMNVACYTDFEDFIKHDMDAVILANYATEHATYAIRCLNSGLHVLSEVLPCETMSQAVRLAEAVEKSGKVYAYAENYCYMQATFEMWKKYLSGDIGEVQYAECEYIHDCSACWPQISYGDKNHWRNRLYATYYCTHSLGPIIAMTGLRPVSVTGFEVAAGKRANSELGITHGLGIEMVTLENGAIIKSAHGGLRRSPGSVNYQLYGQNGMMETGRFPENKAFNCYIEKEKFNEGSWQHYDPINSIKTELANKKASHNGSDFYATYFFIQKILEKPDGKWSIDVYKALDMGICGILAWRSVLNGNIPVKIPDFRNPKEREAFRNDNACTNPEIAKDSLVPVSLASNTDIPDSVYEKLHSLWQNGLNANGDKDEIYSKL